MNNLGGVTETSKQAAGRNTGKQAHAKGYKLRQTDRQTDTQR